ncbi:hypothetical protein SASPL_104807 [Salvia splendens]|uniref:Uncharacterized protein n=1 Tax=Salvia splendens TaxID=180675 RepID=A0A8X9AB10_SALSN|nr:hypothetical protein SASPL_104807 [Salvia splendens]
MKCRVKLGGGQTTVEMDPQISAAVSTVLFGFVFPMSYESPLPFYCSPGESSTQDIGCNQPIHENMLEDIEVEELELEEEGEGMALPASKKRKHVVRNSLAPEMVEALICSEDWLRSSSSSVDLMEEEGEPIPFLKKQYYETVEALYKDGKVMWPLDGAELGELERTHSSDHDES